MSKALKSSLYQHCLQQVQQRIETAKKAIADAQAAANNNTKSSAGDKYETGRAMMQMERDKATTHLAGTLELEKSLKGMDPEVPLDEVAYGSLVKTQEHYFFVGVPLGKIELEDQVYWAISAVSPVGAQLLGKKAGESTTFNGRLYSIEGVW